MCIPLVLTKENNAGRREKAGECLGGDMRVKNKNVSRSEAINNTHDCITYVELPFTRLSTHSNTVFTEHPHKSNLKLSYVLT